MAAVAEAQSTRRPDLNMFKRALRDPRQSLSVQGNLGASFYDAITRPEGVDQSQLPPDRGWGSYASAALMYNVSLGQLHLDASAGTYLTYYPDLPDPFRAAFYPGANVNTGYRWQLGQKTSAGFTAGLNYRPLYSATVTPNVGGGFGGVGTGPDVIQGGESFLPMDSSFVDGTFLTTTLGFRLQHELSRRWYATADYNYGRDYVFGTTTPDQYPNLWHQDTGAAMHFRLSDHSSVRGGYRFSEAHSDTSVYRSSMADVGIDYGDGLQIRLARHTTLGFNLGAAGYVDNAGTQHYTATGSAILTHDMGRTWRSNAYYARGLDTSDLLFTEPILSDSAGASINGLLTRQTGFHAAMSAQGGALAFGTDNTHLFRLAFNVGIQRSFGRYIAFSTEYYTYKYDFDDSVPLPVGMTRRGANQGAFVSLSAWAPIFERGGRSNATR